MLHGLRTVLAGLVAVVSLMSAAPVLAQTVSSNGPGNSPAQISDALPAGGEVVDPANVRLTEFTFQIKQASGPATAIPEVYEWDGTNVIGTPLWTGPGVAITTAGYLPYTFTPNLTVDPTKQYAVVVRQGAPGQSFDIQGSTVDQDTGYLAVEFAGSWVTDTSTELNFSAVFDSGAAPVPTLSEWAMILLGLMLAGGAAVVIQRRRLAG